MTTPLQSLRDAAFSLDSPTTSPSPIIPPPGEAPHTQVRHWLVLLHYIYPLFLLLFFLSGLTWWGIHTSGKKPKPAWASPPITARSTPARGRSPHTGLVDSRNATGGGGSEVSEADDDEDRLSDVVPQDRLAGGRGFLARIGARFGAWFAGDLEDYGSESQKGSGSGGYGKPSKNVGLTPIRKALFSWGLLLVICSFMANSANIILHALVKTGWWCGQDVVVGYTSFWSTRIGFLRG